MKRFIIMIFLLMLALGIYAQNVSDKQSVAVFKLSYDGWDMPNALYNAIDSLIMQTFSSMKRFDVIAMSHRISSNDLNEFIQKISQDRQSNFELPEKVLAGKQAFTKSDWENIINAYVLVLPSVIDYSFETITKKVDTNNDGVEDSIKYSYLLGVTVNIQLINMETNTPIANFTLQQSGVGSSPEMAFFFVASAMMVDLQYHLRDVPDFQIKTGISDVSGTTVEFELGSDMGIKVGDEFVVIRNERKNGILYERQVALIMVVQVSDKTSKAKILYSEDKVLFADQLTELARLPMEFKPYSNIRLAVLPVQEKLRIKGGIGLSVIHTRGFYRFRPLYGVEFNFSSETFTEGLPVNMFVGCQLGNVFIGRFQFSPEIQIGGGMLIKSLTDEPEFGSVFIKGLLGFNFLVTKDIKLGFDFGACLDLKNKNTALVMTSDLILQLGLTIK